MKKLLLFAFTVLLLSLSISYMSGCNKKAASYNPDFIGTWENVTIIDTANNILSYNEIIIEKRDGLFRRYCSSLCDGTPCNCSVQESGRAVVSTDKKSMKIGSNGTVLSIDKEPYQDNGQWKMKIQGLTFVRQ